MPCVTSPPATLLTNGTFVPVLDSFLLCCKRELDTAWTPSCCRKRGYASEKSPLAGRVQNSLEFLRLQKHINPHGYDHAHTWKGYGPHLELSA
eukprot:1155206-Pelagomonas_calceolata.AAC.2